MSEENPLLKARQTAGRGRGRRPVTAGEDGVKAVGELDGVTEGVSKLLLQGDVMGRIIGKKGATIKEIREKSGATVDVRSACSLSCCC